MNSAQQCRVSEFFCSLKFASKCLCIKEFVSNNNCLCNLATFMAIGCFKKPHLQKKCDFFNPKNVTIGSGIEQKIAIFLTHWSENAHFTVF